METETMTALEMVSLYETLVRENGMRHYRIHRKSQYMQKHKDTFKRLKLVLDNKEIPIEDYMRVQFMNKGFRPYPNQMAGETAFNRWEDFKRTENAKGEHDMQERYLAQYLKQDYTLEEALNFDQFYWYFRCMKLKPHPALWKYKAIQELRKMPELRKLIERGYFGETI